MQKKKPAPRKPDRTAVEVRTPAQFQAVASPVRDQILQVVVNQTPPGGEEGISIREIGEQLGRKPSSLYRHIEDLVRVGLIRELGPVASGGRDATVYASAGSVVVLVTPDRQGAAMEALCDCIERTATHAGRETAAATRQRPQGERDAASLSMFGWLDEGQRERLRELLAEVAGVFEHGRRRPGTRLVGATMLLRPVRLPDGTTAEETDAG